MEKTAEKISFEIIKKLCEDAGCIPLVISQTPLAGQEVDNGMDIDFDLPEFALLYIHPTLDNWEKCYRSIYKWERENGVSRGTFEFGHSELDVQNHKDLAQELFERDEYKVVWQNDELLGKEPLFPLT